MAKINWLLFCDKVRERSNGSHDLIGVRDVYRFNSLPAVQPKLCFAYEIELLPADTGFLRFNIVHLDLGHVTVIGEPYPCIKGVLKFIVTKELENIQFSEFGNYSLDIYFNKSRIHSATFQVLPYGSRPQDKAKLN